MEAKTSFRFSHKLPPVTNGNTGTPPLFFTLHLYADRNVEQTLLCSLDYITNCISTSYNSYVTGVKYSCNNRKLLLRPK